MSSEDILLHGSRLVKDTLTPELASTTEAVIHIDDRVLAVETALPGKEPVLAEGTVNDYYKGNKTWSNLATAVKAIVLTGLDKTVSTAISATDSVLDAFGKIQAQIDGLITSLSSKADTATVETELALKASVIAMNDALALKSDSSAVATALSGKADKAITLAGYNISDAYTKTETDTRIQAVIGSAPAALDTLQELAAQLSTDENAVSSLTNTVSQKADKSYVDTSLASKEGSIAVGTNSQYWRGDKSWRDLATDVLATILTGLSTLTATAVVSTDSILIAIGKLQAQINTHATSIASKEATIVAGTTSQYYRGDKSWRDLATDILATVLNGLSTVTASAIVSTDSILVAFGKIQAQITANAALVSGKADKATTLAGYGIVDGIDIMSLAIPNGIATLGPNTKLSVEQIPQIDWTTYISGKPTTIAGFNISDAYTKTETDARIQAVVGAAPAALDTLVEIAAQLSNDESAVSALTISVASKADSATVTAALATKADASATTTALAGKEATIAAGTTSQYFRGDKTWRDFVTDVLGAVLTGLSVATSSAVVSTDTLLVGIGKLQAQINTHTTSIAAKEGTITAGTTSQFWRGDKTWVDFATTVRASVLTGLSTATSTVVAAADSVLVAIGKLQAQIDAGLAYVDSAIAAERSATATLTSKTLVSPVIRNHTEFPYTANISGAVTVDLTNGTLQELTLTANTTITLPASVNGKSYTLIIGYTGAFVPSFAGGGVLKWAGQAAPPAKSVSGFFDIFVFTCDGTNTFGRSGGSNF